MNILPLYFSFIIKEILKMEDSNIPLPAYTPHRPAGTRLMGVEGSAVVGDEYTAPSQENGRLKQIKLVCTGVFVYDTIKGAFKGSVQSHGCSKRCQPVQVVVKKKMLGHLFHFNFFLI